MPGELPTEIEQFIFEHIDSLEKLEVLLLLSAAPERDWSPEAVYESIKSSPDSVRRRLETLVSDGLLSVAESEGRKTYRYQPPNPEMASVVQKLAEAYRERRLKVIESVFSKPLGPIRSFADAFKFRKDRNDG